MSCCLGRTEPGGGEAGSVAGFEAVLDNMATFAEELWPVTGPEVLWPVTGPEEL